MCPLLVFSGGEGLVRLTEQYDIDKAQEEATAAQIGNALRAGIEIDIENLEPAEPPVLPPVIIEEIERSKQSWTQARIESVIEDKDPRGRSVHKMRLREVDKNALESWETGFMPGSIIEGWRFVDDTHDGFHFSAINDVPTDGIDPDLDSVAEVDPGWYKI